MTKRKQQLPSKKFIPLLVVLGVAIIGFAALVASKAAGPFVAIEPEGGTVTAPAQVVNDSTASASNAVKFAAGTSGGGGGICTNPFASSSQATGTISIPNTNFQVRNEVWNGSAGPQTINVCSEKSWYVMSNQINQEGAVESYPHSLYNVSGSKAIPQYASITSTFAEEYQSIGDWNAGYDIWLNNWSKEVMIWNEWHGTPSYWPAQATITANLGGVPYHFYDNGGELMFFRDTQVKSGSVDILAAFNFLVAQGKLKSTDKPTQIEYGVEICGTVGNQRFDTTGYTVSLN